MGDKGADNSSIQLRKGTTSSAAADTGGGDIDLNSTSLRHSLAALLAGAALAASLSEVFAQAPPITISPDVPSDISTPAFTGMISAPAGPGGAPNATPEDASRFAWQEFIALNWPSSFDKDKKRGWPDKGLRFGEPKFDGPTVWQTFRGKVEIFPGQGMPPGYPGTGPDDPSKGFDAPPAYHYSVDVLPCDKPDLTATPKTPFINLDEVDQITLDYMFAGVVDPSSSKGNSAPQLIRFMAKANEVEYAYVAKNGWWNSVPDPIILATRNYLAMNRASPDAGSSAYVSLPYGTIEMKAAWRPLNDSELNSGRFHTQLVRFYEHDEQRALCYRDATWGLVALHIIQKTPSAPYFIYASFEQSDNLLTEDGKYVEDTEGRVQLPAPPTATTPQVCLVDPSPQPPTLRPPVADMPSSMGRVVLTDDPATCVPSGEQVPACSPGERLYYINEYPTTPSVPDLGTTKKYPAPLGNICVNKRDNEIPQYAIDASQEAHDAMRAYFQRENIASSPWLYYKLVNVQYYPYDKFITNPAPNGSLYDSSSPYTATNPARSNFYMANIVVETNRALQLFSGGLSPSVSTDWNEDRSGHRNTYYGGNFYNAGGCLGCHGSQGQIPGVLACAASPKPVGCRPGKPLAGDFSVILARGSVNLPEVPSYPAVRASAAAALPGEAAPSMPYIRNRSLRE